MLLKNASALKKADASNKPMLQEGGQRLSKEVSASPQPECDGLGQVLAELSLLRHPWNGDDPAVGKQVRSLQDQLGEEDVWVVAPDSA